MAGMPWCLGAAATAAGRRRTAEPPPGSSRPGTGAPGRDAGAAAAGSASPIRSTSSEHDGWTSLFDGKTLNGWSGDSNWKVEDGAIIIESTCEKPTGTVYLVWQGGEAADFELKLEMKGTGNINGGVQYRGWIAPGRSVAAGRSAPAPARERCAGAARAAGGAASPAAAPARQRRRRTSAGVPVARGNQGPCPSGAPRGTPPDAKSEEQWNMWGAQYHFDAGNRYTGQFYEQSTGRGIVAWKGQVVRTEKGKNPRLLATLGEPAVIDCVSTSRTSGTNSTSSRPATR